MQVFTVLFILYFICNVAGIRNFCPISSAIDVLNDQMNPYPIDIFNKDAMTSTITKNLYRCVSGTGENHTCTAASGCPLDENDWLSYISNSIGALDSFCDIRNALKDPKKTIRVEVYGGSMTNGAVAYGCCCDHNIDEKCPNRNVSTSCGDKSFGNGDACRWGDRIGQWLRNISSGIIHYHNHAYSGGNSRDATHYITKDTKDYPYTKTDIIFLDFSVNDAKYFSKRGVANDLKLALESSIRQIFYNSEPDSWPTVILLEEYPWTNGQQTKHVFTTNFGFDYSSVYKEVAKEFRIPLWSYRQFVLDAFEKSRHQAYLEYLLLETEGGAHPRWFIHLLYADLIAASILHSFHECASIAGSPPTHRTSHDMKLDALPGISDPKTCKQNGIVLLDVAADRVASTKNIPCLGIYCDEIESTTGSSVSPSRAVVRSVPIDGGWGLVDDGRQRIGWVTCQGMNDTSIAAIAPRSCPVIPANALQANLLLFEVANSSMVLNKENTAYIFQIKYLRTYSEFVGSVDVYFCNRKITRLNSRWDPENMANFSVPEIFYYEYQTDGKENYWCVTDGNPINLEFRPVGNGRFKLISIVMCQQQHQFT